MGEDCIKLKTVFSALLRTNVLKGEKCYGYHKFKLGGKELHIARFCDTPIPYCYYYFFSPNSQLGHLSLKLLKFQYIQNIFLSIFRFPMQGFNFLFFICLFKFKFCIFFINLFTFIFHFSSYTELRCNKF